MAPPGPTGPSYFVADRQTQETHLLTYVTIINIVSSGQYKQFKVFRISPHKIPVKLVTSGAQTFLKQFSLRKQNVQPKKIMNKM